MRAAAAIEPLGDSALRVGLGDEPDAATVARVQAAARTLLEAPPAGLREVVPAYTTLTLHYRPEDVAGEADDLRPPWQRLAAQVQALLRRPRRRAAAVAPVADPPVALRHRSTRS